MITVFKAELIKIRSCLITKRSCLITFWNCLITIRSHLITIGSQKIAVCSLLHQWNILLWNFHIALSHYGRYLLYFTLLLLSYYTHESSGLLLQVGSSLSRFRVLYMKLIFANSLANPAGFCGKNLFLDSYSRPNYKKNTECGVVYACVYRRPRFHHFVRLVTQRVLPGPLCGLGADW